MADDYVPAAPTPGLGRALELREDPSVFEAIFRFISRPAYIFRGMLTGDYGASGRNVLQFINETTLLGGVTGWTPTRILGGPYDITSRKERPEFTDVLGTWGVKSPKLMTPWEKLGWDVVGGALTDPISLIGGGEALAAKLGPKVLQGSRAGLDLYELIRRAGGKELQALLDAAEESAYAHARHSEALRWLWETSPTIQAQTAPKIERLRRAAARVREAHTQHVWRERLSPRARHALGDARRIAGDAPGPFEIGETPEQWVQSVQDMLGRPLGEVVGPENMADLWEQHVVLPRQIGIPRQDQTEALRNAVGPRLNPNEILDVPVRLVGSHGNEAVETSLQATGPRMRLFSAEPRVPMRTPPGAWDINTDPYFAALQEKRIVPEQFRAQARAQIDRVVKGRAAEHVFQRVVTSGDGLQSLQRTFRPLPAGSTAEQIASWASRANGMDAARAEISSLIDSGRRFAMIPVGVVNGMAPTDPLRLALTRSVREGNLRTARVGAFGQPMHLIYRPVDGMVARTIARDLNLAVTQLPTHRAMGASLKNGLRKLGYEEEWIREFLGTRVPRNVLHGTPTTGVLPDLDEALRLGVNLPQSVANEGFELLVKHGLSPGSGLSFNPLWSSTLGKKIEDLTGWHYRNGYNYVPWRTLGNLTLPGATWAVLDKIGWKGHHAFDKTIEESATRLYRAFVDKTFVGRVLPSALRELSLKIGGERHARYTQAERKYSEAIAAWENPDLAEVLAGDLEEAGLAYHRVADTRQMIRHALSWVGAPAEGPPSVALTDVLDRLNSYAEGLYDVVDSDQALLDTEPFRWAPATGIVQVPLEFPHRFPDIPQAQPPLSQTFENVGYGSSVMARLDQGLANHLPWGPRLTRSVLQGIVERSSDPSATRVVRRAGVAARRILDAAEQRRFAAWQVRRGVVQTAKTVVRLNDEIHAIDAYLDPADVLRGLRRGLGFPESTGPEVDALNAAWNSMVRRGMTAWENIARDTLGARGARTPWEVTTARGRIHNVHHGLMARLDSLMEIRRGLLDRIDTIQFHQHLQGQGLRRRRVIDPRNLPPDLPPGRAEYEARHAQHAGGGVADTGRAVDRAQVQRAIQERQQTLQAPFQWEGEVTAPRYIVTDPAASATMQTLGELPPRGIRVGRARPRNLDRLGFPVDPDQLPRRLTPQPVRPRRETTIRNAPRAEPIEFEEIDGMLFPAPGAALAPPAHDPIVLARVGPTEGEHLIEALTETFNNVEAGIRQTMEDLDLLATGMERADFATRFSTIQTNSRVPGMDAQRAYVPLQEIITSIAGWRNESLDSWRTIRNVLEDHLTLPRAQRNAGTVIDREMIVPASQALWRTRNPRSIHTVDELRGRMDDLFGQGSSVTSDALAHRARRLAETRDLLEDSTRTAAGRRRTVGAQGPERVDNLRLEQFRSDDAPEAQRALNRVISDEAMRLIDGALTEDFIAQWVSRLEGRRQGLGLQMAPHIRNLVKLVQDDMGRIAEDVILTFKRPRDLLGRPPRSAQRSTLRRPNAQGEPSLNPRPMWSATRQTRGPGFGAPTPSPEIPDSASPFYLPLQIENRLVQMLTDDQAPSVMKNRIMSVFEQARSHRSTEDFLRTIRILANDLGLEDDAEDLMQTNFAALGFKRNIAHIESKARQEFYQGAAKIAAKHGGAPWSVYRTYIDGVLRPVGPRRNTFLKVMQGGTLRFRIPENWGATAVQALNRSTANPRFASIKRVEGERVLDIKFPGLGWIYKPMLTSHPLNIRFRFRNNTSAPIMAMFHPEVGFPGFKQLYRVFRYDGMVRWAIRKFTNDATGWGPDLNSQTLLQAPPEARVALVVPTFVRALTAESYAERRAMRDIIEQLPGGPGKYTWREAMNMLDRFLGHTITQADLNEGVESMAAMFPRLHDPMTDANAVGKFVEGFRRYIKFGEQLVSEQEHHWRALIALTLMEKGKSATEIMSEVNRLFVDYSRQSEVETWLRATIPFARFMVGSTQWAADVASNPGNVGKGIVGRAASLQTLARAQQSGTTEEQAVPFQVQQSLALPIPWRDREGNMQFLMSLGFPHEQTLNMLGVLGLRPESIRQDVLGGVHPALKAPIEGFLGHSFYFGTEWGSYRKSPPWLRPIAEEVPGPGGKTLYEVPGWVNEVNNAMPYANVDTTISRLLDDRQSVVTRLLTALTGFRIQSVDTEAELRRRIGDYLKEAQRRGEVSELEIFFSRLDPSQVSPELQLVLDEMGKLRDERKKKAAAKKKGSP